MSEEVRVVDETTGGEKGQKLARFDLIPPDVMWELAEHYGKGCEKYAPRNWQRGYGWSLSYSAGMRHLHQWLMGQRTDEETGSRHIIAAIWHLIAIAWFEAHEVGTDDLRQIGDVGPLHDEAERLEERLRELESELQERMNVPPPVFGTSAVAWGDREPQPTDGPDFHAEHAAWRHRQREASPHWGDADFDGRGDRGGLDIG